MRTGDSSRFRGWANKDLGDYENYKFQRVELTYVKSYTHQMMHLTWTHAVFRM